MTCAASSTADGHRRLYLLDLRSVFYGAKSAPYLRTYNYAASAFISA